MRWDEVSALRALLAKGGRVAHLVPAPFLHCGPLDPSVLVTAPHWDAVGVPLVVTLHDLIPLRAPHRYLPTPAHHDRYRTRGAWVAGADLVLSDSEYTRAEAIALLECDPEKIVNIGCGVSRFFTPNDGTDGEHFRWYLGELEDQPFVLTVGGSDVRKGTERLTSRRWGSWCEAGFDLRPPRHRRVDPAVAGATRGRRQERGNDGARGSRRRGGR